MKKVIIMQPYGCAYDESLPVLGPELTSMYQWVLTVSQTVSGTVNQTGK